MAERGSTSVECDHGRRVRKLNESLKEPSESHSESDSGTIEPRLGPARDEAGSSARGVGESGDNDSSEDSLPLASDGLPLASDGLPLAPSAHEVGSMEVEALGALVAASAGAPARYAARARLDGFRRPAPKCGAIDGGGRCSSSVLAPPASPAGAPSWYLAGKDPPSPSESTSYPSTYPSRRPAAGQRAGCRSVSAPSPRRGRAATDWRSAPIDRPLRMRAGAPPPAATESAPPSALIGAKPLLAVRGRRV